MRKTLAVNINESLYALISELARAERRSISNFVEQLLSVSLADPLDRQALFEKMNPALTASLPAIRKERARLAALST